MKVKSLSCVRLLATPWSVAHQDPPSMGFSRQESWSGVPSPSLMYIYVWILLFSQPHGLQHTRFLCSPLSFGVYSYSQSACYLPDTVLGTEEWSSECLKTMKIKCSSDGSDSKESACSLGDLGTIPGLGSSPGGGNGSPLQYLCLKIPGQMRLVGYSPWGLKESDTTLQLTHTLKTMRRTYMH